MLVEPATMSIVRQTATSELQTEGTRIAVSEYRNGNNVVYPAWNAYFRRIVS